MERGTIRVLDLLRIRKREDGTQDFLELGDLEATEIGTPGSYETEMVMLLSENHVTAIAASVELGSTAALLAAADASRHRAGGLAGHLPLQLA